MVDYNSDAGQCFGSADWNAGQYHGTNNSHEPAEAPLALCVEVNNFLRQEAHETDPACTPGAVVRHHVP